MYSGNIGLYYDLENLIKVVRKFGVGTKTADGREVVFAFVGAGSVLDKLKFHVFSLLWKVFLIQRRYSLSSNSQLS